MGSQSEGCVQSMPTTRKRRLAWACAMPKDEAFSGYSDDQLIMLSTEVTGWSQNPLGGDAPSSKCW